MLSGSRSSSDSSRRLLLAVPCRLPLLADSPSLPTPPPCGAAEEQDRRLLDVTITTSGLPDETRVIYSDDPADGRTTPVDELRWNAADKSANGTWYWSGGRSDGGVIGPVPACGWAMRFTITRNAAAVDDKHGCTQNGVASADCRQTKFTGLRYAEICGACSAMRGLGCFVCGVLCHAWPRVLRVSRSSGASCVA